MTVLAWALAIGSLAFAIVNVVFEATGRFDEGPWADYSSAISIINWFVFVVKVVGAGVALLSVTSRPPLAPRVVNFSIWGAAGVLSVYALGSVGQAIGLVLGPDAVEQINGAGILYVTLFLLAAAGFVILASSHTRRFGIGRAPAIGGAVGGVGLLGFILLILPAILSALGLMPSP
ncbi:MAG: hypothetical protein WCA93_08335 [Acidimicrobiia bacterium]